MSSIRQVVPIILSIQIAVAVGVTSWISFSSSERTVQKLTRDVCDSLKYNVGQQINAYLQDSVRVNKAMTIALSNGSVNPNDINQVEKDIFSKVRELNTQNILFYGSESGTMVGIEHQNGSNFLLRIREDGNSPYRPTYELNSNGERGKKVMNEIYDHRSRPWYIIAKNADKPIWSQIFLSTTDGELTTTQATPIYNASGVFEGVTGINISLKQIGQFMTQARPTDKWSMFLVEGNGNLVATTNNSPVFEKTGSQVKQLEISQSKDPLLHDANLAIKTQFGGFQNLQDAQIVDFKSGGEEYILGTNKLNKDLNLDWSVGVIVPKSIFMQEINDNNRVTIAIIVTMLGINILIGLAISAWLLRPIKNLMNAAKEIEEESFNPEELDSVAQRKDELGQMARVFQEMGSTIADRQNGMKSQLSKLREEKDEAKKIAIASQMGQSNSLQQILSRARSLRSK